jgi:hypothetical protein
MKRIHLAATGWALSCLLAACGGGNSTDNATPDATTQSQTAQDTLREQAQAARRPAPEQFTRRLREVDETIVWQQTETTVANTTAQRSYTDHVTAVNADGSYAFERLVGAAAPFERYTSDADGNRLGRDVLNNGNHCSYNPGRNFVNFPLYVGKTWLTGWTQNCTLGYTETVTQLAAVTARETITTTAGSFDALRLGYVAVITKSNDANLQNGSTGEAMYLQESTCWWATDVKRIVKCSYKNTYFGTTPPASYLKSYTFEASFIGKQYFPGAKRVGSSSGWSETDTLVNGNVLSRNYTQTVTAVNADGSYGIDRIETSGVLGERYVNDRSGNRMLRFIASTNNNCAYEPRREYLNFPLYVGKSWAANWHYGCAIGYREDAAHTARVEALETITVGAGSFEALRISFHTSLTNSNDFQLQGGATGQGAYAHDGVCWWSPQLRGLIKCTFDGSFVGPVPATYRQRYATEMAVLPTTTP